MQRRKFLKNSIAACASTLLLDSMYNKAFAGSPMLDGLRGVDNDKVLVLVQLNGGNDGLNTVLPLDQYTNLAAARANILIPEASVLKLNGNSTTGLHPSMGGMKDLYDNKYLSLIQGVSYPNPNYSHFRATDIWLSGSEYDQYLMTGTLGRYLSEEFNNYPTGYPNATMPDPLAIQIGSSVSMALQGADISMGISVTNISGTITLGTSNTDAVPLTPAGHELAFLRQTSAQTQSYNAVIKAAAAACPTNSSTKYPVTPNNSLGDQLKSVARLIKGGLKTKIYIVSMNGFDTHSNQLTTQASLLSTLSLGIEAFQDDCIKMGISDRVTGMVFSEFGRRIVSNASGGTDHGAGAPVILFGTQLVGGMYGTNPVIGANLTNGSNIPMQHDYRQVFHNIMTDWFGVKDPSLSKITLNPYANMSLFKKKGGVGIDNLDMKMNKINSIIPNPISTSGTIEITSRGEHITLKLFDIQGKKSMTILDQKVEVGTHQIPFHKADIHAGIYILEMMSSEGKVTRELIIE
jgi:uncharacterized protein (DUF1501 family)